MLIGLGIRDVVLIETLDLSFGPGLTALTGETGAGKSIILDALGLATGSRGDAGLVLNTVGGLTSLVADIAARGSPRANREGNRESTAVEKNATPARFRRQES